MKLPASDVPELEPREVLEMLSKGWFTSNRSTDDMLPGTSNEEAVLAAFKLEIYIENIFKVGMYAISHSHGLDVQWMALQYLTEAFALQMKTTIANHQIHTLRL